MFLILINLLEKNNQSDIIKLIYVIFIISYSPVLEIQWLFPSSVYEGK